MAGQPLHYFQMWSLVRQSYNGGVTQAEAAKVGVPLRAIAASGNKAPDRRPAQVRGGAGGRDGVRARH